MEKTRTGQFRLRRRIGSTNYRITAHFSESSGEGMEEKILRMIRNETMEKSGKCDIIGDTTNEPSGLKGVQE